jgi:hypothetical protein
MKVLRILFVAIFALTGFCVGFDCVMYVQKVTADRMVEEVKFKYAEAYMNNGYDPRMDHDGLPEFGSYQLDQAIYRVLKNNPDVTIYIVDNRYAFIKKEIRFGK